MHDFIHLHLLSGDAGASTEWTIPNTALTEPAPALGKGT